MGIERERLRARFTAARNGGLESPPSPGGPRAGVAMRIRAVGVVVRGRLRSCCPNCEAPMSEADALGLRSPGIYPKPPRGTRAYMCPSCAHVEYVRAPSVWARVRKALRGISS